MLFFLGRSFLERRRGPVFARQVWLVSPRGLRRHRDTRSHSGGGLRFVVVLSTVFGVTVLVELVAVLVEA